MADRSRKFLGCTEKSTYRLIFESPLESPWEEYLMESVEMQSAIPAEEMADLVELSRLISEGKPVTDPALLQRIYERSEEVQRRIREKHGVVEWAVDLIREARDEE
jgi:hypothetical protein